MSEIIIDGDFAEFKIAYIDLDIANQIVSSHPTSAYILSILASSRKHKTFRGFKLNSSISLGDDTVEIDEIDNVFYKLKRIPIKDRAILFYGVAWKQQSAVEVDVDDQTSIYELPLDVTEYRITDKVRFKLVDIPKGFQVIPSERLMVENAAVQFPNNHIVEVISVRNDN